MPWPLHLLKSLKRNSLLTLKNLNNLNLRVVLGISNLIHVFKIVYWVSKVFFIDKSIYILSHIETNYLKKKS